MSDLVASIQPKEPLLQEGPIPKVGNQVIQHGISVGKPVIEQIRDLTLVESGRPGRFIQGMQARHYSSFTTELLD